MADFGKRLWLGHRVFRLPNCKRLSSFLALIDSIPFDTELAALKISLTEQAVACKIQKCYNLAHLTVVSYIRPMDCIGGLWRGGWEYRVQ